MLFLLQSYTRAFTSVVRGPYKLCAWVISDAGKFDHGLKTILHNELRRLDVPERIEYKLGVTVYRCLHGRARRYFADHLIPASDAAPRRRCLPFSVKGNRLTDSHCALLSTQHVRLSGVPLRRFDSMELAPDELRDSGSFMVLMVLEKVENNSL